MWLKDCWYVAAWDYELKPGEIISRTILNQPVALYRSSDGGLVALEDRCCHRFAPLSLGRLEADDLRCMYHGLKFDRTGRCIEIPGQDMIPRTACVRTYPVVQRHSWIWVWMGDRARADAALIPDAVGMDDPAWRLRAGHIDIDADYRLLNDNLTDFSHVGFVHARSIGLSDGFSHLLPKVQELERGFRAWRWLPPGTMEPAGRTAVAAPRDTWQAYRYLAPGVMVMRIAQFQAGVAERCGGGRPPASEQPLFDSMTCQAFTPMAERSSRYFFSYGPWARGPGPRAADAMFESAKAAFLEDKVMVEAQQRMIDLDPTRAEVRIASDTTGMRFRAVMKRLAEAEAAADRTLAAAAPHSVGEA